MAGKPEGELADAIRARLRREGAEQTVELSGFIGRDRMQSFYQEADIFCSPAQHEAGVANVFIEAMACGIPVVASHAGGGAEAVLPGETGLLVPPLSVDAVTEALDRLLGDAALRARMGAAGRRRVEQYFALDRYMERVMGVYARATETARQRQLELKQKEGV
jgi:glycosyltransferase involved in cell wall biosynthesis